MKKINPLLIAAIFLMLAASSTRAANLRFIWSGGGAGDGVDFADPGNWGGEAADGTNLPGDIVDPGPGDASNVIMQTGGTSSTSLTAPFTPANPFDIFIVRSGHTFDLSANLTLSGIPTLVGQTGTGSAINHSAGTFTSANMTIGDLTLAGVGAYNISGTGNLTAAALTLNTNSTLSISGASAMISADSLSLDDESLLDFTFGPTGINAIELVGAFNITPGAQLTIDGSGYTSGPGSIDLVNFGGNTGMFADPAGITIDGFAGFDTAIGYDANTMFLTLSIPEPSSLALLLLGGAALYLRRRK